MLINRSQTEYVIYIPIVTNNHHCSEKSGAAFGWGLPYSAFSQLCISNFHEYNVLPDTTNYNANKYLFYWCDEWVSPRSGEVYNYRQSMTDNWSYYYDGYLILFNEWTYPDQCQMTEQELIDETRWIVENYPYAKFIIGNTYGHDHLNDYAVFKRQTDLMIQAGLTWDRVYGVGIHDYTDDYVGAVEKIRTAMDSYGERKPIYITEFVGVGNNLSERIDYYNSQNDIAVWFYFAPCNPEDEYTLVYREVTPETLQCSGELTELGYEFVRGK